jgi:tRNA dimethylallyltransferase
LRVSRLIIAEVGKMREMGYGKLLIICGQTGTGKTALGLELAKEFDGEIVSADARQAYRGMDVVTGKGVGSSKFKVKSSKLQFKIQNEIQEDIQVGVYEVSGIPIWGYDLVRPDEEFSVKLWRDFARRIIQDIWKRGKLPIVVGGTGLYLRALTEPLERMGVPRDTKLRRELKGKRAEELFEMLAKCDFERAKEMNESDRKNPRRLIRAIEIARFRSQESGVRSQNECERNAGDRVQHFDCAQCKDPEYRIQNNAKRQIPNFKFTNALWVGLKFSDGDELSRRIGERVEERLADERIVDELNYLMEKDYLRYVPKVTIGYQQLIDWMGGNLSFKEMTEKWKRAERQYAKRQMTWFGKQKNIKWLEVGVGERDAFEGVRERVGEWVRMKGG